MDGILKKVLSQNLVRLRAEKKLTQAASAKGLGVSLRYYSELDAGTANPSLTILENAASFLDSEVCDLLRLNNLKINCNEEQFRERVKQVFLNEDFGYVIRDFEGILLWGNKVISRILETDLTQKKINLFEAKSPEAAHTFRINMNAELMGKASPYFNLATAPNAQKLLMRVYPTVIFSPQNSKPIYTCSLIVPVRSDSGKLYKTLCAKLLGCLD